MGGRVGLKGTDGVVDQALRLGARPVAPGKAAETLRALQMLLAHVEWRIAIRWVTCAGGMGADYLVEAGFAEPEVVFEANSDTTQDDTKAAVRNFVAEDVSLILFCGGDGTARDICRVTGQSTPILGIPSGVKMYSGVFGISPVRTAEILVGFLQGKLSATEVDVLDLDEERYRAGEWVVRLYDSACTPYEPAFTQSAKMVVAESTDSGAKEDIADYLVEVIDGRPDALLLLGPGTTVASIGKQLELDKTLLGVDAVIDGNMVGKDLNERQILELLNRHQSRMLVLSPIGAQGFVLGRGNLQLSPDVVRTIGAQNIVVVSTPAKLSRTPVLRFDTGERALDTELAKTGYLSVVVGYHRRRMVKVAI